MLGPTKRMGHPSPPPSLANAALRQASDDGSEGMARRSPINQFCSTQPMEPSYAGAGVNGESKSFSWSLPSHNTSKKSFLAPLMSETIRITVDARYRTRWPSDVRIDAAYRKDKSGPIEFFAIWSVHEAQATRERQSRRVAVYSIQFGSCGIEGDSIRPAAHLYD